MIYNGIFLAFTPDKTNAERGYKGWESVPRSLYSELLQ